MDKDKRESILSKISTLRELEGITPKKYEDLLEMYVLLGEYNEAINIYNEI